MNTFLLARKIEDAARMGVEVVVQFEYGVVKFVVRTQGVGSKWYGHTQALTYEELHQCRVGDDPLWTSILDRTITRVLTAASQAVIEDFDKIVAGPMHAGAPNYTLPPAEWHEPEGSFG